MNTVTPKVTGRAAALLTIAFVCLCITQANGQVDSPIRVVWWNNIPHSISENGTPHGFGIDVLHSVFEQMRIEQKNVQLVKADSFSEAYKLVLDGQADVGGIPILQRANREREIDFSFSALNTGYRVILRTGTKRKTSVLEILTGFELLRTLLISIVIVFTMANLIWLAERNREGSDFDSTYLKGVYEAFWWATVTVTTVGYGDRTPHRPIGRLLAIVWMVLGLFLVSFFIASITSAMTVNAIESNITSINDLKQLKIATLTNSAFSAYLDDRAVAYKGFAVNTEMYAALEDGTVDAVFYDANSVDYYSKWEAQGKSYVVGPIIQPTEQSFFFTDGHPLLDEFNLALLQIREDGRWQAIHDRYFRIKSDGQWR